MGKKTEERLESWSDFERILSQHPGKESGGQFVFRGQADRNWRLEPSLLRWLRDLGLPNREEAVRLEVDALHSFQRSWTHPKRPGDERWEPWWGIMQHYGSVTRVLDWSGSAAVGLYFACNDRLNKDAKLYVLELDALPRPPGCFGTQYDGNHPIRDVEKHRIFETGRPVGLHWCRFARPPYIRMAAQAGWFTACTDIMLNHKVALRRRWADGRTYGQTLTEYLIPKEKKGKYLQQLRSHGVDGARLYADVPDGVGYLQKETIAILRSQRQR